ncbi:hypothetical protein BHM03_00015302 [Ensete ventricosum]|nr:hypothetical protein BHM03_00015302 [Ensete ventricosum]
MAEEEQKEEKPSSPPIITLKESDGDRENTISSRVSVLVGSSVVVLRVLRSSSASCFRSLFSLSLLVGSVKVISLLWGDLTGSAQAFEKWVALVRKRSGKIRPSGFPHRHPKGETMPISCFVTIHHRSVDVGSDQRWLRLLRPKGSDRRARKAVIGAVEEQGWLGSEKQRRRCDRGAGGKRPEQQDRATTKVVEVGLGRKMRAMVGVRRSLAVVPHQTYILCSSYVHGSPLLEGSNAFQTREAAAKAAAALGRVLMLDLILRNEDRLPCPQLGWRGNYANLLVADKVTSENMDAVCEASSATTSCGPQVTRFLQKEKRSNSANARLHPHVKDPSCESSDSFSEFSNKLVKIENAEDYNNGDFYVMAIDSGVPRRPPAGKRAKDQERYPKLVELLLNNVDYSSNLLYEISGGRLGHPVSGEANSLNVSCSSLNDTDAAAIVNEFRGGFRAALRDLQSFHLFLLTLYQKLDGLLRVFLSIISKSSGDSDRDDMGTSDLPSHSAGFGHSTPSPACKQHSATELSNCIMQKATPKSSPPGSRGSPESVSPISRENWNGRYFKGSEEPSRSLRLTMKLRDFHKLPKVRNLLEEIPISQHLLEEQKKSENPIWRSLFVTVVLIQVSEFLMLLYSTFRGYTLSEAWNTLKKVHRRAQPNDGFAKVLLDLDRMIHGETSMKWQHKRPVMKVCPICGKNAGLSTSSLKLHLQKSHRRISSGSVDSAMTMEIQKAVEALKFNCGSSVSPTQKQPQSIIGRL